jgi:hypothetical protein
MWIYITTDQNQHILGKSASYDNRKQRTFLISNYVRNLRFDLMGVSDAEAALYFPVSQVGTACWRHLVCVWDKAVNDGKAQVYIDNVEASYTAQDAMTVALRGDSTSLYIGKAYDNTKKVCGQARRHPHL